MNVGYIWGESIPTMEPFRDWLLVDKSNFDELVYKTLEDTKVAILKGSEETRTKLHQFEEQLDQVVVSFDSSREIAWQRFLDSLSPGSKVIVRSFEEMSLDPHKQLEFLNLARDKQILVVPYDHKEVIELSFESASALMERSASRTIAITPKRKSEQANYERMLTLMKMDKSVVEILEETGWSRSTLFRLRREHKDKLAKDLPTFKKRYE